jgi:hypothetical protein
VWTKITGGFGAVVIAPTALATSFENLTEDYYTYKIEVTDNGATASDLLNIIRIKDYILSLNSKSIRNKYLQERKKIK